VTRIRFITLITYLKKHCFYKLNNPNYFTKYFANDYNPVIGEFIQDKKEIGNYPNLDFINARIQN
jgi:hypothetical protein